MAARTTAPQPKQEEPHIILEVPWNTRLTLPASMAGEFLPHIRFMKEKYEQGVSTYTFSDEPPTFKLLSASAITAAAVTAALTTGD